MRGFLTVIHKLKSKELKKSLVKEIIDKNKGIEHIVVECSSNDISHFYYTNENLDSLNQSYSKNVSLVGQFIEEEKNIINYLQVNDNATIYNYLSELNGAFAIAHISSNGSRIDYYTHVFRIDNIFYYENDSIIVVGTDPLIVSVFSNDQYKPLIDVSNSVSFLMNGYFCDEQTMFKDLKIVPPNTHMAISEGILSFNKINNIEDELFKNPLDDETVKNLTEEYVTALSIVPKTDEKVSIGLTGGKDSRMALVGLLNSGFQVKSSTRGFDDSADVIVAKEIAEKLNVEHSVVAPKLHEDTLVKVNIVERSLNSMIATSGQISGSSAMSLRGKYSNKIAITGVGALSMKGGYSYLNKVRPRNVAKEFTRRFAPSSALFLEGKADKYLEFLESFSKQGFQRAQYLHSLYYRNGRWTSAARLTKEYSSTIYSPFYDNVFSQEVMKIQKSYMDSGELQFGIINKLDSEIANHRLANNRWGFEEFEPKNIEDYNNWLERYPVHSSTKISKYNWRSLSNPKNSMVIEEFKKFLLNNPEHEVYEVVDYKKIKEIFSTKITSTHSKFLWSLLSLKVYIDYLLEREIVSSTIEIPIEADKVLDISDNKMIVDVTNEMTNSNNSLIKDNNTFMVNPLKIDKNRYITIFDSSLSRPPNTQLVSIINIKDLRYFAKVATDQALTIKLCFMYYSSKDLIKREWHSIDFSEGINTINVKSRRPDDAQKFNLAINIGKKSEFETLEFIYSYFSKE